MCNCNTQTQQFNIQENGAAYATIWIHPDDVKVVIEDCMADGNDLIDYMAILIHFAIDNIRHNHLSGPK